MEKQIEKYLRDKVQQNGGLCLKLTNYVGIPDRMVLFRGRVWFIEVKDTGKQLRPEQMIWQKRLLDMRFNAMVIDSRDGVNEFVSKMVKGKGRDVS